MPTDKGKELVAEMKEIFSSSPLVVAAEYRGVDVTQMTGLRQELRSNGARFKVVKILLRVLQPTKLVNLNLRMS